MRHKPFADINIVPYVDVMLVLLVIFMITTPLLTQGVEIDMPQANAEMISMAEVEPLVISVDREGQYYLNVASHSDEPIHPEQLATRVAAEIQLAQQQGQEITVLIKGDSQVDYGTVVSAMTLLQQAGAQSIGLMTQPAQERELI